MDVASWDIQTTKITCKVERSLLAFSQKSNTGVQLKNIIAILLQSLHWPLHHSFKTQHLWCHIISTYCGVAKVTDYFTIVSFDTEELQTMLGIQDNWANTRRYNISHNKSQVVQIIYTQSDTDYYFSELHFTNPRSCGHIWIHHENQIAQKINLYWHLSKRNCSSRYTASF